MAQVVESLPASQISSPSGEDNQMHPLHSKWTLWFDKGARGNWEDNLKSIVTIGSVEEFWASLNNFIRPTELANGANIHLFREGVKPAWEDAANKGGGRFLATLNGSQRDSFDRLWINACMTCVGESLSLSSDNSNSNVEELNLEDLITGCVASMRRGGNRVAIWVRKAPSQRHLDLIAQHLNRLTGNVAGAEDSLASPFNFEYQPHA